MNVISFLIWEDLIEDLDELVAEGIYPSRSTAIRIAVKDLLKKHGVEVESR